MLLFFEIDSWLKMPTSEIPQNTPDFYENLLFLELYSEMYNDNYHNNDNWNGIPLWYGSYSTNWWLKMDLSNSYSSKWVNWEKLANN